MPHRRMTLCAIFVASCAPSTSSVDRLAPLPAGTDPATWAFFDGEGRLWAGVRGEPAYFRYDAASDSLRLAGRSMREGEPIGAEGIAGPDGGYWAMDSVPGERASRFRRMDVETGEWQSVGIALAGLVPGDAYPAGDRWIAYALATDWQVCAAEADILAWQCASLPGSPTTNPAPIIDGDGHLWVGWGSSLHRLAPDLSVERTIECGAETWDCDATPNALRLPNGHLAVMIGSARAAPTVFEIDGEGDIVSTSAPASATPTRAGGTFAVQPYGFALDDSGRALTILSTDYDDGPASILRLEDGAWTIVVDGLPHLFRFRTTGWPNAVLTHVDGVPGTSRLTL